MPHPDVIRTITEGNTHKLVPESIYLAHLNAKYQEASALTGLETTDSVEFMPEKHLQYYTSPAIKNRFQSTRRLTMEELGLTNKNQISPIGVSDPFPLFTKEAIDIMRQEVLQKQLFLEFARFSYSSTSGMDVAMRGYVKNDDKISASFTYQCWTHPKTMELVSMMAGVELEIVMDYEIAHLNVSMKDPAQAEEERLQHSNTRDPDGTNIPAVVGWHYDSYPFVCVLMLSDTTEMIGGETSLRMGENLAARYSDDDDQPASRIAVVPGPQLGSAAVLQGRLIEHIAPSPVGISERITMVTSYRAKDPTKKDMSVLSTVKPEINYGSRYNNFYSQWIEYRVQVLKDRLDMVSRLSRNSSGVFQKEETTRALHQIEEYLANTYKEMEVSDEEYSRAAGVILPLDS